MSISAISLVNQLTSVTRQLSELIPQQEEQLQNVQSQLQHTQEQLKQVQEQLKQAHDHTNALQSSLAKSQAEVARLNESIIRLTNDNMQLRDANQPFQLQSAHTAAQLGGGDKEQTASQSTEEIHRMLDDDEPTKQPRIPISDKIAAAIDQSKRLRYTATHKLTEHINEEGHKLLGDAHSCLKAVEEVSLDQMPEAYIDELGLVLSGRCQSYGALKNQNAVRDTISELFSVKPDWYKAHALRGFYLAKRQPDEAVKSFQEALKLNPPEKDRIKIQNKIAFLTKTKKEDENSVSLKEHNKNETIKPDNQDNQSINQSNNQSIKPSNTLATSSKEKKDERSLAPKRRAQAVHVLDESSTLATSSPISIVSNANALKESRPTSAVARALSPHPSSPQPFSPRPRERDTEGFSSSQPDKHDWSMFPRITDVGIMDLIGMEAFAQAEIEHKANLQGGLRSYRRTMSNNPMLESLLTIIPTEKPSKKRKLDVENETPMKSPFKNSQEDVKKYTRSRVEFEGNRVHQWKCTCGEGELSSDGVPCKHVGVALLLLQDKQQQFPLSTTHPSMYVNPANDYSRLNEYGRYFDGYPVNSTFDKSLSLMLSQNHLPTSGLKSLLVARCIDGAIHGVGKSCPTCAGRTYWANGAWRCKGKFDHFTKHVERCNWKSTTWTTTPWEVK